MKIKAIVFDYDGTLVDTLGQHYGAVCEVFFVANVGVPSREAFFQRLNIPFASCYREFGVGKGISDNQIWRIYNLALLSEFQKNPSCLFPEVLGILRDFSAMKIKLGIVSATSRERLEKEYSRLGLRSFFSFVRGEVEDKTSAIQEAITSFNLRPDEVCFVSDFAWDMDAGRSAGVFPIGITRGISSANALNQHGARHCVTDLNELKRLLEIGV